MIPLHLEESVYKWSLNPLAQYEYFNMYIDLKNIVISEEEAKLYPRCCEQKFIDSNFSYDRYYTYLFFFNHFESIKRINKIATIYTKYHKVFCLNEKIAIYLLIIFLFVILFTLSTAYFIKFKSTG